MAGLVVATPPADEPISLTEAKDFLRIDDQVDERIIKLLLGASREWAENYTGRSFINRTLKLTLDGVADAYEPLQEGIYSGAYMPAKVDRIRLPQGPAYSITSIKSYDDAGTATTFDSSNYFLDNSGSIGYVVLRDGASWPTDIRNANGIEINYVAGYGDNAYDVPEAIRLAILQYLVFSYEHRGEVEGRPTMPPQSIESLLRPYRIMGFSSNPFKAGGR